MLYVTAYAFQGCQVGIFKAKFQKFGLFLVVWHEKMVLGMYVIVWRFLAFLMVVA